MALAKEDLVEVKELVKYFPIRAGFFGKTQSYVHAVDGVSFNIKKGQTLGLVGESGCGKTTVGRLVLRLLDRTQGQVIFGDEDIFSFTPDEVKQFRREAQLVFQDAFSSFDTRRTVGDIVGEPLRVHRIARGSELMDRVAELLRTVGLKPELIKEYPHTLSSGQKQCVGIARAIALNPKFVVADEPISSLDVSVRAQILNLLKDLQEMKDLTYLFISHDIRVVRWLSTNIAVMYVGKMVEYAETKELFNHRFHPYTEALLNAVPIEDPRMRCERKILLGEVPSPVDPAPGCRFAPRCEQALDRCRLEDPPFVERTPGHWVACFVDFHEQGQVC